MFTIALRRMTNKQSIMWCAMCALAASFFGGMASCATAQKAVNKTAEVGAKVLLPPSEENKLGEQFSAQIEQDAAISTDPAVQSYIQQLGGKVAAAARGRTPDGISFSFKVIDDPKTINAFAIPGGHIYVYSGLILAAENEAELVGVLGHEVAHVTERHVAERLVTAYGLEALTSMALGQNSGQVGQIVAGALGQGYLLKYGRDQERESDQVGLGYVLGSGYNPKGMVTFFQKLAANSASVPTFLSSHPDPGERAQRLSQLIAQRGNVPSNMGGASFQQVRASIQSGTTVSQPAETMTNPSSTSQTPTPTTTTTKPRRRTRGR